MRNGRKRRSGALNMTDQSSSPKVSYPRLLPGWKGNLLLFGILILTVLAYFLWQVKQVHQTFFNHAREHARMLASVIELNARGAILSQRSVEEIMQIFLGNMARFS